MSSIHIMEYYLAIKNKALTQATLMLVYSTILSERSQAPKTTCCMIPFLYSIYMLRMGKSIQTESGRLELGAMGLVDTTNEHAGFIGRVMKMF